MRSGRCLIILAGEQRIPPPPPEHGAALERLWQFSRAQDGQRLGAAVLGGANLAGVAYLGSLLGQPGAAYTLARNGLGFMMGLFPALQARNLLRPLSVFVDAALLFSRLFHLLLACATW